MKKLFFLISVTSVLLFAKPCMTDIYTGNGINTTDEQALENMIALEDFMLYKARLASRLNTQKYNVDYSFKYIHNPDHGFNNDMMETYYQLKESGQISDGFFHTMFSFLAGDIPENALHKKYMDIVDMYEADVNNIYWKYYSLSFSQKHNVLLVSHSQGNLIGNKVYTLLSETEKKKFRMISVATPANYVLNQEQTSPYVTVRADHAILSLIASGAGSLAGNVGGTGHNFITTYMGEDSEARHMIASYVKSAYDNLLQTSSCIQYSQIFILVANTLDHVKLYASRVGVNVSEHIETIPLVTYAPPIEKITPQGYIYYVCSNDEYTFGSLNIFGSEQNGYATWLPGTIYSTTQLESRKGITHSVKSRYGLCADLTLSGELYDLALTTLQ